MEFCAELASALSRSRKAAGREGFKRPRFLSWRAKGFYGISLVQGGQGIRRWAWAVGPSERRSQIIPGDGEQFSGKRHSHEGSRQSQRCVLNQLVGNSGICRRP